MYIDLVSLSRYVSRYVPLDVVRTETTVPDESAEMRWSTTIWLATDCGESALPRITRPDTVRTSPGVPCVPVAGGSGPCAKPGAERKAQSAKSSSPPPFAL